MIMKLSNEMQYRHYTLHPDVEEFFTYNYNNFLIKNLIQKKYYINKKELKIELVLPQNININMDFFIKLENLPPMSISNIKIKISSITPKNNIYNLDWINIYLYNIRIYPELVEQNIFILPNIIILNNLYFQYIMEIELNKEYLYEYYFKTLSKNIFNILPYPDEINKLIISLLSNFIYLDIWYKDCSDNNNCDRACRMLKTSYHNIYIRNIYSPIINNKAELHIHKNIIQNNNILLTLINPNYDKGIWEILPNLDKIHIINKNITYIITIF